MHISFYLQRVLLSTAYHQNREVIHHFHDSTPPYIHFCAKLGTPSMQGKHANIKLVELRLCYVPLHTQNMRNITA